MVGSVAGNMLLRAAWRRASLAATSVALRRSSVPTRGLRLRVVDHAPHSAVPSEAEAVLRPLYMDVQATTPLDPRVLDAMLPYLVNYYGNPHSRTHAYGWESEAAMERARQVSTKGSEKFHPVVCGRHFFLRNGNSCFSRRNSDRSSGV
ncbi:nitrogen fixation gene 1 (S. cerevisiae), isoform CRA_a [Rattus norvegicus]|uniref:Nitrogen fixation gene 1 (S. cerevisiae), isoform CRA_a n=1 Tax=Rattus norvegicus TaxID=10116 RepID=A6KI90_RAT|nr:nitrogen fixation gene 1 (S. cerevisiae), isoform CRA_a [Rattus norvegicus]